MRILVTGFNSFGGDTINPASIILENLPKSINNNEILTLELPTEFKKSSELLKKYIDLIQPNIIISIGLAGGRSNISIERIAINIDDARIPDNSGYSPIDETIQSEGDTAYFSTLPIKAIIKNLKNKNIPCEISNTAGTFVCNHIMYEALYYIKKNKLNINSGFIHIPYLVEQNKAPSLELETMVKAINIAILTSIEYFGKYDVKISQGKEF